MHVRLLQYSYGNGKVWYALITFLYVDILGKPVLRLDTFRLWLTFAPL